MDHNLDLNSCKGCTKYLINLQAALESSYIQKSDKYIQSQNILSKLLLKCK